VPICWAAAAAAPGSRVLLTFVQQPFACPHVMFWAGLGKPVQKTASLSNMLKLLSWNASVWDPPQLNLKFLSHLDFWLKSWLTSQPPRASDYAAREYLGVSLALNSYDLRAVPLWNGSNITGNLLHRRNTTAVALR